jgi:tRNA1Val (adenine37-N6)-methyltransferase
MIDVFKFKHFTIHQDRCAMKVGTDGILLGAWINVNFIESGKPISALDIGLGSGLISMALAQRNSNLLIDGVEIDGDAFGQSLENIRQSPFANRIFPVNISFQDYKPAKRYDLIFSNPPYFSNSLKGADNKRNMARHNDGLPLKSLIEHSLELIGEYGKIALILPVELTEELDFLIAINNLYTTERTEVVYVEGHKPKRFLIEISRQNVNPVYNTITLETKEHRKTGDYFELTKDFYL